MTFLILILLGTFFYSLTLGHTELKREKSVEIKEENVASLGMEEGT